MKKSISLLLGIIMILFTVQPAFSVMATEEEVISNPLISMSFAKDEVVLSIDGYGESEKELFDILTLKGEDEEKTATYDKLEWSTSLDEVATVDENGKVTAVANGNCIITVKQMIFEAEDGEESEEKEFTYGLEASMKISVRDSVGKYYAEIEQVKLKIPTDYTESGKYLASAVESLTAALEKYDDARDLENTEENCSALSEILSELTAAYELLLNSELVKIDDEEFYDKWNSAFSLIPEDLNESGLYEKEGVDAVTAIVNKAVNPETPWLKNDTDKALIDAVAEELSEAVNALVRLKNPLEEMTFSKDEIVLHADGLGKSEIDASTLLVLGGRYDDETVDHGDFEWTTTKSSVATVDKDGVLTAVGNGECILTVKEVVITDEGIDYGAIASVKVTVRDSIAKYYDAIETMKSNLPSDYLNKEKYLPASVDALVAVLDEIQSLGELEDTKENCATVSALSEKLTKAYATLLDSVLVDDYDTDFYAKWREAYAKRPYDFYFDGVYTDESIAPLKEIINQVTNPETPWLNNDTDKAKIDALAEQFTAELENLKKHTTSISINYKYNGQSYPVRGTISRYLESEVTSFVLLAETDGDDDIIWTSSDNNVVRIDGTGKKVMAKFVGGCQNVNNPYVTVTATSNGHKAECTFKVINPLYDVKLKSDTLTVFVGHQAQIEYELIGADPDAPVTDTPTVIWTSGNTQIATVDEKGVVSAIKDGTCEITLKCETMESGTIERKVKLISATSYLVEKLTPTSDIPSAVTVNASVSARVLVIPDSATKRTLEWTSSNPSVAEITGVIMENGTSISRATITGKKEGTAVITYKATDGSGKSGSFVITVNPLVSSIKLNKNSLMIYVGDSQRVKLSATLLPTNAGNQQLAWISSDESVAEVTDGMITPYTVGTCEIVAFTTDGSGLSASCTLTIVGDTKEMIFNKSSAQLKVGQTVQLDCMAKTNETQYKVTQWKSSNESIATVSANGLVTAKYPGTATITATALDGREQQCTITVIAELKGIKLPSTLTLAVGKEKTLAVTYDPAYATNKNVTWKTGDKSVALVDTNGKITAVGTGTATITAISKEGSYVATCRVTVIRPATSVKLNKSTYSLTMGSKESVKLTATVEPTNATVKTVSWTTSNNKVATVSSTGIVTAVGPGTANITVTTIDGGYTATCKVTVIQPLKGLKFKNSKETFYVGKESKVDMVFTPSNASNKNCTWKSSDKSVATVDSKGVIKAVAVGNCTITATSKDGGYKATCKLTVVKKVYPRSVSLNKKKATIKAGNTLQLKATISPSNASVKAVKWTTSDKTVATVNSSGLVTAKKGGTVTITCTTKSSGKKATCKITVTQKVEKITLSVSAITLVTGRTKTLTASVSPSSATNKEIKWYSGNTKIATVDKNGKVKAVSAGTVYITAKSKGNSKALARCKLTVIQSPKKINLSLEEATLKRGAKMTLTATVSPSNSYDKTVEWSSNKTSVARVSSDGVVTAVSKGKATITCRSAVNDNAIGVCVVTVEEPVRSIALKINRLTLTTGKTKTLTYTITPSYASNQNVTFKTSDSEVVTVNKKGVVEAVGPGTATVTVKTKDGLFVDKCIITVIEPVILIKLNKTSMTLEVAKSKTLKATIKPSNATNKELTWRSSNSMIARVSQSGKVTALKTGTVTITCSSADGVQATCKVTCVIGVEALELNKTSITLSKGKTKTLKATIEPKDATIKDVTWSSSDESVATVDKNGKITAKKKGTATITCKTKQGGYKATCTVKVK